MKLSSHILVIDFITLLIALVIGPPAMTQGLTIPSGAYLIANTGNITLQNNWTNNGSFTHNGGTLIFTGTTQTLGGTTPSTFNNLTIAASSITTILTAGQKLKGILLSNNTLKANGNLTLLSTATGTASVDGNGTGEVSGNLIMQRYLPSGFGYKYFSSPFTADTVGDFSSAINLATSFPDFYRYDENLASAGYVNYTASSGLLVPLIGYVVNFGASAVPLTVSLKGVVNNHTISSPTLFNHNQTFTKGFNLAGNPYPSPIDWKSSTGWTKTNIDDAIYFFSAGTTDQYTGTYSSYINGVSSNGIAGNIIAAMQGFFIHVSNGAFPVTATLSVNNNARNTNPSVIFFGGRTVTSPGDGSPPPLLRLSAGFADGNNNSDPVVIYFNANATAAFDKELDALKLMNTHTGVPSLYAVATDSSLLSIQALPYPGDLLQQVPLNLQTAQDGPILFHVDDLQNMPAYLHVYFYDSRTGSNQELSQGTAYRLYLAKGDYTNRFFLKFGPTETTTIAPDPNDLFDAYNTGGSLLVKSHLPPGEKGDLIVASLGGQVICRTTITDNDNHLISMAPFAAGIYIVRFAAGSATGSKKIFFGKHERH